MTVSISRLDPEGVLLQMRVEGPGGLIGDASAEVQPGGDWHGVPYRVLRAHVGQTVTWAQLQAAARTTP